MNLLKLQNISFSYHNSPIVLFDELNLQIQDKWTVIAGNNGCGKSTLLKIIAGMIVPDSGSVVFDGSIIYCPQETAEIPENLYSSFWSNDNQIRKFFSILEVTEEMLERYETLSGGEKKRIQIACALAEKTDLLLLDEPTNHLDKATVQIILQALKNYDGMGIIVSHDRHFADSLCTRTLFLFNEAKAFDGGKNQTVYEAYSYGLSKTIEVKNKNTSNSRKQWNSLNDKVNSEKQKSQRLLEEIAKSKNRLAKKTIDVKDHDTKRRVDVARISGKDKGPGNEKSRIESLIHQTEEQRDSVKKSLKRKEGFSIHNIDYSKPIDIPETVIKVGNYSLQIPHFEINSSSRISLTGENGTGKTLFISFIIDLLSESGRLEQVMYLPQEINDSQKNKVLNSFMALEENKKGEVLSTLYRLGSEPDNLNCNSESVSPGELRKLMISMSITEPLSLLILDEPTNHMDITSVLALENALAGINCGLLVISHDYAFLEKITTENLMAIRVGRNNGKIELM